VVSLAEELGAKTAILTGSDAAAAVLEYARSQNISTIVLGRGPSRRLPLRRHLADKLAAAGEDVDLIEIGQGGKAEGTSVLATPIPRDTLNPRAGEKRLRYMKTTAICLLVTAVAVLVGAPAGVGYAAYQQDASMRGMLPRGTTVAGVDVSKLTRAAFLCQPEHRVTFHFTPKHASWLNQIEIWFSILVRKLLRRGNFASKKALRTKIEQFIAYFNRTMAKPFRWTMEAKPLTG